MSSSASTGPQRRRPSPRPTVRTIEPGAWGPERRLREAVGVSSDASISSFRAAYDLAMHRATRAGDQQRALALSQAYDRLPLLTRELLYPNSRTSTCGAAPPWPPLQGRVGKGGRPAPRRPRRRRELWTRLFVYGVFAPLAIVAGTYFGAHATRTAPARELGPQHPIPAFVPTATHFAGAGTPVLVPSSAPTGGNGLVSLMCQPGAGRAGYLMMAPRGAIVTCTNGATPAVVG